MRFTGDNVRGAASTGQIDHWRAKLSHNALKISREVTPELAERWETVLDRLEIAHASASAYVYASADLSADVMLDDSAQCVVRFSSGLVDKLDAQEFMFVAGHELGHFLLGHSGMPGGGDPTLEDLMAVRAGEISVDRVGLLAAGDVDTSVRAMMKSLSGLGGTHLRFDVQAFLRQLNQGRAVEAVSMGNSTHPSFLVRTRALLWFAMTGSHLAGTPALSPEERERIDARIHSDLARFVDGPARDAIREASDDVLLWMCAATIVQQGKFSKDAQSAVRAHFGPELVDKLTTFLGGLAHRAAPEAVGKKVLDASRALQSMIPRGFPNEIRKIGLQVESMLHTQIASMCDDNASATDT